MEEHYAGRYHEVLSHGQARVFGFTDLKAGETHSLYDQQWEQTFDAEDNRTIKMQTYYQACAVSMACEWCNEAKATGYISYQCSCCPGGWGKDWVCDTCRCW